MNESAFETNVIVLPLVFLLIFAFVMLFYTSWHAGLMMLLAMLFATTLTYAYMGTHWSFVVALLFGFGLDRPYLWAGQKTPGSWEDVD